MKIKYCFFDSFFRVNLLLVVLSLLFSVNNLRNNFFVNQSEIKLVIKGGEGTNYFLNNTFYKNASEVMRGVLVQTVNLDINEDVKKIKCPTLLIWGTEDTAVPYSDAVALEKIIPNCGLVTYEGCTHYAYLERLDQTNNVLRSFIGSDKK